MRTPPCRRGSGYEMRLLGSAVLGAGLWIVMLGTPGEGQIIPQPTVRGRPALPSIDGRKDDDPDLPSPALAERQERTRNSDRQKKLVEDTNRLLTVATDLKREVEKSSKDVPAEDAARKAEEIEKLAKSVKDRMKG